METGSTKISSLTDSPTKCPAFAGISLLELSVVMFLMAVLLGFSLPRFSNFLESDLETESRKIAALLNELRLQAILNGEAYRLVFDTKNSEYSVYQIDPKDASAVIPHQKYSKPLKLRPPVEFEKVTRDREEETDSFLGFEKIEFDKIFGQTFEFRIDSSGFIDLFTLKLKNRDHFIELKVKTVMGDIRIGEEVPL